MSKLSDRVVDIGDEFVKVVSAPPPPPPILDPALRQVLEEWTPEELRAALDLANDVQKSGEEP
jgi:hypothetical protein